MKKILLTFLLLVLITSCKKTSNDSISDDAQEEDSKIVDDEDNINYYFKALGTEPFWGLKIGDEKISFTSLISGKEKFIFPVNASTKITNEDDLKVYKISNETVNAVISIYQIVCQDQMTGMVSPYRVVIEIKNKKEITFTKLEGCGCFKTENRLEKKF